MSNIFILAHGLKMGFAVPVATPDPSYLTYETRVNTDTVHRSRVNTEPFMKNRVNTETLHRVRVRARN